MNDGIIFGKVIDSQTSQGLEHISVTLNHVRGSVEFGNLPVRSLEGTNLVQATTDGGGYFVLGFRWDPIRLGAVADNAQYQLNLQALVSQGGYPTARLLTRHRGNLATVVNLRAVADGRIPDLRNPTSASRQIVQLAMNINRAMRNTSVPDSPRHTRNLRVPNMFLSPGRPSAEYYALMGAAEIRVQGDSRFMSWD